MKKLAIVAAISLLASGCAQQSFVVAPSQNAAEATEVTTHHFFISGLGQTETIDAAKVCGSLDKVAKVEAQHTFLNGVLGLVTFGIYTPREARVYCKS